MQKHYNPYYLHGGVFVPHYLLSTCELSHGAKLLYSLLAAKADGRGEVLLNVALMAAEMGEQEQGVFRLMNELDTGHFIRTERHPTSTEFIRCSFARPSWLQNIEASARISKPPATTSDKPVTRSRLSSSFELFDATGQPEQEVAKPLVHNLNGRDNTGQPKSRYSFEDCYRYALACQQAGQRIKNPYRLAKALLKTGEQDEEIVLFLSTGQEQERDRAA